MGRQPTSGYCQTCRRRRVKCDKARPHCRRCLASGHTCGGYDLPLRMQVLGLHAEDDGTKRLVRLPTSSPQHSAHLPAPVIELHLSPSREDASPAYFFTTFNWAPFWRPILLFATNGNFPDVNKACFQAISHGYMGRSVGDAALHAKGGRLYGRVLSEVQSLLTQPAKIQLAKLGYTMVMMGMYEFTMNNIMGRAPPHHVGIIQILRHCGPETFQDPTLLQVYRSCRAMLLCQALCRQSRCFLEATPWTTIPWRHTPKTFEDRLMDIMVQLPGLAEAVATPQNRPACLPKIKALSTALQDWRWAWHATHSSSVRQVRHAGTLDEHTTTATPSGAFLLNHMLHTTLEFTTPRQALDILFYNAALLYLMQLESCATTTSHYPPPPQPEPLTPSEERFIRRQAAAALSPNGSPLLLPGQVKFPCQAAAEAFMTLGCVTRLLASTDGVETVVTPAAIGIVYWILKGFGSSLGEGETIKKLLGRYAVFEEGERVFAGYFVGAGRGGSGNGVGVGVLGGDVGDDCM